MKIINVKNAIQSRTGFFILTLFLLLLIFLLWSNDNEEVSNNIVDAHSDVTQTESGRLVSAVQAVESHSGTISRNTSTGSVASQLKPHTTPPTHTPQELASIRDKFLSAASLTKSNRIQDAQSVYQELIDDYPRVIESYINLAKLHADQNQLEKARVILTQGLNANPNYAVLYSNLQKIHGSLAAQAYRQAVIDSTEAASDALKPLDLQSINSIDTRPANADEIARLKSQLVALNSEQQKASTKNTELQSRLDGASQKLIQQQEMLSQQSSQINALQNLVSVTNAELESTTEPAVVVTSAKTEQVSENEQNQQEQNQQEQNQQEQNQQELSQKRNNQLAQQLVSSWANAWSAQKVNAYVNFYSNDYRPASGGLTHQQWLEQRRIRLSNKGYIKVTVSDFEVVDMNDKFSVNFLQHYRSDRLNDRIRKQLVFQKDGLDWQQAKIIKETILK